MDKENSSHLNKASKYFGKINESYNQGKHIKTKSRIQVNHKKFMSHNILWHKLITLAHKLLTYSVQVNIGPPVNLIFQCMIYAEEIEEAGKEFPHCSINSGSS